MSFCPQCGAPTNAAMPFCTACGRTLTAPTQTGPELAPGVAPPAMAPSASGPTGKTVAPWLVILLTFVTLGIYPYFLWWRASREMDAYAGSRSHTLVRVGVAISLLGVLLTFALAVSAVSTMFEAIMADPEQPPDPALFTTAMTSSPFYLLALVAQGAGAAALYTGLARTWSALRDAETQLGRRDPVEPRTFLAIGISAAVASIVAALINIAATPTDGVPSVGLAAFSSVMGFASFALFVALLWVMYSTQKRLNELWQASAPRPAGW